LPRGNPANPAVPDMKRIFTEEFLVLTSPETAPQSLNVIVNWPALLKNPAQ
jgi:hypothetical protein